MIKPNDIYISSNGTPHYVRVVDMRREFFKGESIQNTAPIYQIGLQRQTDKFIDDPSFETFSMHDGAFQDTYELFIAQPFYTPAISFMRCLISLFKGLL